MQASGPRPLVVEDGGLVLRARHLKPLWNSINSDGCKQLSLFDVRLKTKTYEKAKALDSWWDIYVLEAQEKDGGKQQQG